MKFDENFFRGEERCGFYIEGEMKRAWAAELEVLAEVDRICRKHNIKYFADSGTLLGAIRHNGFIPWDDDLDIAMLRKDFMHFIRVAQSELKNTEVCVNVYQHDWWIEPFGRVVNGVSGIQLTQEHLDRYHGCPYSVGVDIFILDDMPDTEAEYDTTVEMYEWAASIRDMYVYKEELLERFEGEMDEKEKQWAIACEEQVRQMEDACNMIIDRNGNIPNRLLRIIDGLFAMYNGPDAKLVTNFPFVKKGSYHLVGRNKEWYRDSIRVPFENTTIPVPIEFHKVLERAYGPNYLRPVRTWNYHNYPFYKENKRKLQEARKDMRNIQGKLKDLERVLNEGE